MAGGPSVTADDLVQSPAWLPLETVGRTAVRLVRLDEEAYRQASFLDQRLLTQGYERRDCDLTQLESAAARLTVRAHYIFHIGHVGSTLVSRLVGAHPGFFAVREPALLRALALQGPSDGAPRLEAVLALLSRTWHAGQHAVVKATSFVSELAPSMLTAAEDAAAVFMFVEPLVYLRTILAGANSRAETRQLGGLRLQRLERRLGGDDFRPDPRSEGEWLAMSWLCEMTALREAADRVGAARVRWVDFDRFLGEPRSGLEDILAALGLRPAAAEVESLVNGALMRRYSKAPEYGYDAALRREVLRSAEREHPEEIRRGMEWLRGIGRHPLARRAFEIAAAERL
jgi:hypothetical protein